MEIAHYSVDNMVDYMPDNLPPEIILIWMYKVNMHYRPASGIISKRPSNSTSTISMCIYKATPVVYSAMG